LIVSSRVRFVNQAPHLAPRPFATPRDRSRGRKPNPLILSEQGKLRAEGILTLNVYHGNGVNSFVQADPRGGEGLFGATGKAGARFVW
jgi:hypothetical protein